MRTTVTLDADVEALLRTVMRNKGISFKDAINSAVRSGLANKKRVSGKPFSQRTFRMGFRPEFRWEKAMAMADAMEDEEIIRKLALRK